MTPGLRDPRDVPGAARDRQIWIGIGWQLTQLIQEAPSAFHLTNPLGMSRYLDDRLCQCWRCRALRMIRFGPDGKADVSR